MTAKTADLQGSIETADIDNDDAAKDFLERLNEFRDSLPDREKAILAQTVVDAVGESGESGESGTEAPAPPTDEEMDSFMQKLDAFHDSLPGDMHLFVDHMLAKTVFADQADVQGYHLIRLSRWQNIPRWELNNYRQWCASIGGDWVQWRRRGGRLTIACFDNTHI